MKHIQNIETQEVKKVSDKVALDLILYTKKPVWRYISKHEYKEKIREEIPVISQ